MALNAPRKRYVVKGTRIKDDDGNYRGDGEVVELTEATAKHYNRHGLLSPYFGEDGAVDETELEGPNVEPGAAEYDKMRIKELEEQLAQAKKVLAKGVADKRSGAASSADVELGENETKTTRVAVGKNSITVTETPKVDKTPDHEAVDKEKPILAKVGDHTLVPAEGVAARKNMTAHTQEEGVLEQVTEFDSGAAIIETADTETLNVSMPGVVPVKDPTHGVVEPEDAELGGAVSTSGRVVAARGAEAPKVPVGEANPDVEVESVPAQTAAERLRARRNKTSAATGELAKSDEPKASDYNPNKPKAS